MNIIHHQVILNKTYQTINNIKKNNTDKCDYITIAWDLYNPLKSCITRPWPLSSSEGLLLKSDPQESVLSMVALPSPRRLSRWPTGSSWPTGSYNSSPSSSATVWREEKIVTYLNDHSTSIHFPLWLKSFSLSYMHNKSLKILPSFFKYLTNTSLFTQVLP